MGIDIDEVHEAMVVNAAYTPDSLHGPASEDEGDLYTLMDVQQDESEPLEDVYRRARLQEVLDTPSPRYREILILRLVEGREKAEIARVLGMGLDEVASRLRDAIDAVRTQV